jgi:glycosyltransferase involved in cell wall biosynthesis/precorrin-6B methylase 2
LIRRDDRIGVLFFTSAPFLGGAVFGLRCIARLLDRKRFCPVVALPEGAAELIDFFRSEDVVIAPIRTRPLARWSPAGALDLARTVNELARVCREHRIHIFYSNSPRALLLGPLLRAHTGVKFVWNVAMFGQPWYLHLLARSADVATCVSRAVYREFGARTNMRVIYVGAFTEKLSPEQCRMRRTALRAELGIPESTVVLGCVANLQYWKGIHVLLDALAIASRAVPEVLLVHLGGGVPGYSGYAKQIDARIAALGLAPRIRRLGFRPDAYRYYPVFDLLVHVPVIEGRHGASEAFGSPVAEAMGYRLPVIASRLGGPAEIVEEGVTGELIEPGNCRALAEKIMALARDPGRRSRLGAAGYARYLEHFTIEREVRDYERLYLELVAPDGAPSPAALPPPRSADESRTPGDARVCNGKSRGVAALTSSDSRIGVLYLTTAPFLGGAVYGLRSIVRYLDRRRFRPVVALPEAVGEVIEFFRGEDVTIAPIRTRALARWSPTTALDLARTVGELARVCREHNLRVFHSTSPRAAVLGPLLRARTGVKFVWQIAMLGQPWWSHALARFPNRAACVSAAVYREYGARKNMRVIHNGPWTEGLTESQCRERRLALRAELGIPEDTLVVGSVANLQFWKGIHVLLDAFAIAARAMPEIRLVHLGGLAPGYEKYAQQIDAQIAALGLAPRLLRLGFRRDAHRYYPVFDLFVHVPVTEGRHGSTESFGHSVAEAMGYRLPVIASRLGGPAEIVEEGVTGELIEPGDSRELAEKLIALLRDPERRDSMGAAGYARYREHFTIEREVRDYERLYLELLPPNGAPAAAFSSEPPQGRADFRAHWQRLDADTCFSNKMRLAELEQLPFVALLEKLLEDSPAPPRVLEIGAGSAAASRLLASRVNARVVALDLLPEAVRVARRLLPPESDGRPSLLAADVFRAPFADASFDLVFSQGLVEHFSDPLGVLAAHARLVKPGGWLVINVPQALNPYTLFKHWKMRRGAWPPGWETEYSPRGLARLAPPLGLESIALDGHGSFFRMVVSRGLRPVLPDSAQALLIRAADAAGRLLGSHLRAWTSMNVIACFRKPPGAATSQRVAA